jgi:hypothetical protein
MSDTFFNKFTLPPPRTNNRRSTKLHRAVATGSHVGDCDYYAQATITTQRYVRGRLDNPRRILPMTMCCCSLDGKKN